MSTLANKSTVIAREERPWKSVWDHGKLMRLPRSFLPRNDSNFDQITGIKNEPI